MKATVLKRTGLILLVLAVFAHLSIPAFAADLGEISAMQDTVHPDGENGQIVTVVTGVTDQEGYLAIPLYSKATLQNVTVLSGTLDGELAETKTGATKYYLAKFSEPEQEVSLQLTYLQEETYVIGKAKTKDTAPGDMKAIKYKMVNSSPVKIGSYSLEYAIPQGYELSAIVGYNPEKDFSVYVENGFKYGHQGFGELKPGESASITINMQKSSSALQIGAWIVTAIASAFFLYKNRGMLTEAKELAQKKNSSK